MSIVSRRMARAVIVPVLVSWSVTAARAETAAAKIVIAANKFLSTLDDAQRRGVVFAFDDQQQRVRWSNLPTTFVPRGGMSLKEMNDAQQLRPWLSSQMPLHSFRPRAAEYR
jgi:hypothetical protein